MVYMHELVREQVRVKRVWRNTLACNTYAVRRAIEWFVLRHCLVMDFGEGVCSVWAWSCKGGPPTVYE